MSEEPNVPPQGVSDQSELPADVLRRAISRVESLLYRLERRPPRADVPPAAERPKRATGEAPVARRRADGEADRVFADALARAEWVLAAAEQDAAEMRDQARVRALADLDELAAQRAVARRALEAVRSNAARVSAPESQTLPPELLEALDRSMAAIDAAAETTEHLLAEPATPGDQAPQDEAQG